MKRPRRFDEIYGTTQRLFPTRKSNLHCAVKMDVTFDDLLKAAEEAEKEGESSGNPNAKNKQKKKK